MNIVIYETRDESLKLADDVHKGLLRKYVTVAKMVTNIELCSSVTVLIVLYFTPYLISIATSRWINPLSIKIMGIEYKYTNCNS